MVLSTHRSDFGATSAMIDDLVKQLNEKQCDGELKRIWVVVQYTCDKLDLSPESSTHQRADGQPNRLRDFLMDTKSGQRKDICPEEE